MRRWIASTLGLGLILGKLRGSHGGSGTLGALAAVPLALLTRQAGLAVEIVIVGLVTMAGLWAVRPFAEGDPGWVVIDETAGALLAMTGLSGPPMAVAWVIARIADVTKAFPGVKKAETLPGATGVMADDLVAGMYGLGAGLALTMF
jgi:phosphatidylglycerophosphatase A